MLLDLNLPRKDGRQVLKEIKDDPDLQTIPVVVADSGPGIPAEHLDHIFDRYCQQARGRDGIGVGLAIVKGIVDAHGGAVEVESESGKGATFRVLLQRARNMSTEAVEALEK